MSFNNQELTERVKLIIKELKHLPSLQEMKEVPYWNSLLQDIKSQNGSLKNFLDENIPRDILTANVVDFPNQAQEETTTQMLENPRLLIRDRAGAGKTAPAIKAKPALEQIMLDGQKTNAMVICPNFILSSWQAKLNEYLEKRPNVLTISSSNRHQAIEAFNQGINNNSLDFTLVSYDAIFRETNGRTHDEIEDEEAQVTTPDREEVEDTSLAGRLIEVLDGSERPMVLYLDESHNAKNPKALRSQAVRKLATLSDFLYPITGSPFTDNLDDIGEIASLLDPRNYPTAEDFNRAYERNPKLIRLFLKRFSKTPVIDIKDIDAIPNPVYHDPITFDLSEEERELYDALPEFPDFLPGSKMVLLRLAALDGKLLDPERFKSGRLKEKLTRFFEENPELLEKARNIDSSLYRRLDSLLGEEIFEVKDEEITRKGKVIVWTKLREGITDKLEERYMKYGSCKIDGTVSADIPKGRIFSDRDIQRLEFQTNPDKRVMIATIDALREGQDLHAATDVVTILRDVSPGPNEQAIARAVRMGQQNQVNVYTMHANATINAGIHAMEQNKRADIQDVEKAIELSKEQKQRLSKKTPVVRQPDLSLYFLPPRTLVRFLSGMMTNMGAEQNEIFLGIGENAQLYAQAYNYLWNYSYSAHTARLISQLVEELEERPEIGSLEKIIDIGSGPCTISRTLKRPSLSIDLNPYQLENGKRECEKLGVDVETRKGNAEHLKDVSSEQYDLAISSLVLHYGNYQKGGRKRMLLEASRVLKNGGYFILALPTSIVQGEGREKLEEGLLGLGLKPLESRTGYAKAIDGIEKDYEVYVTLCQKIHSNGEEIYTNDQYNQNFILNPEHFIKRLGQHHPDQNGNGDHKPSGCRKEVCTSFEFENGDILAPPKPIIPRKPKENSPEEIVNIFKTYLVRKEK